jgi:hypothetical protein
VLKDEFFEIERLKNEIKTANRQITLNLDNGKMASKEKEFKTLQL